MNARMLASLFFSPCFSIRSSGSLFLLTIHHDGIFFFFHAQSAWFQLFHDTTSLDTSNQSYDGFPFLLSKEALQTFGVAGDKALPGLFFFFVSILLFASELGLALAD
jgi:hypothetical protein